MTLAARILPRALRDPLFGARDLHGPVPDATDPDWVRWQEEYLNFYGATQKEGVGARVNDAGYRVLEGLDLTGLHVAEIGPGSLPHRGFWTGVPDRLTAIDIHPEFLEIVAARAGCPVEKVLIAPDERRLPLPDASVDLMLSFYSLEHLHPLDAYLADYARVLKPGGRLVGAIPNEGGLLWGLGRFLTSRRWIRRNTGIDYDKIICWEHPNYADTIVAGLDRHFTRERLGAWPLPRAFGPNLNLLTRFSYRKA